MTVSIYRSNRKWGYAYGCFRDRPNIDLILEPLEEYLGYKLPDDGEIEPALVIEKEDLPRWSGNDPRSALLGEAIEAFRLAHPEGQVRHEPPPGAGRFWHWSEDTAEGRAYMREYDKIWSE